MSPHVRDQGKSQRLATCTASPYVVSTRLVWLRWFGLAQKTSSLIKASMFRDANSVLLEKDWLSSQPHATPLLTTLTLTALHCAVGRLKIIDQIWYQRSYNYWYLKSKRWDQTGHATCWVCSKGTWSIKCLKDFPNMVQVGSNAGSSDRQSGAKTTGSNWHCCLLAWHPGSAPTKVTNAWNSLTASYLKAICPSGNHLNTGFPLIRLTSRLIHHLLIPV